MRTTLCILFVLVVAARAVAADPAVVSVKDFDVRPEQIDATVARLVAIPFAEVARPAATVLARAAAERRVYVNRFPGWSDAEFEAELRKFEAPAATVARLVWARHVARADDAAVAGVLSELATDRSGANPDTRRIAVSELGKDGPSKGTLTAEQRSPLYRIVTDDKDDPALRLLAARSLIYATAPPPGPDKENDHSAQWSGLLREIPDIIRAQPTISAQHAAFNNLTALGARLWQLPHERFIELVRLGFELIEQTGERTLAHGYGTARRLGYMLKQPGEFAPPHDDYREADGNLGQKFHARTVENARRWWSETGRRAMDSAAPAVTPAE